MLDIAAKKTGQEKIYILNLKGRIDSVTSRDFEFFYEDILRAGHRYIIFDASALSFVSSSGIASFVKLARRLSSSSGAAVLIHVNPEIKLIFEFFGLNKKIPLLADQNAAKEYLDEEIRKNHHQLEIEEEAEVYRKPEPESVSPAPSVQEPEIQVSEPVIREYESSERILEPFSQNDRQEKTEVKGEVILPEHRMIVCEQCGLNLRVYQTGPHMCPDCGIEFTVKQDGSASFFEKL